MKQVFNPFLPENTYIPDGEPHVFGDRVYLFGSHDMEDGESFCMLDYEGWSAPIDDLGNWECAGTIYSAKQDPLYSEERPYMYAPDAVQGNDGRYYLYYELSGWRGRGGYDGPISVAVCDTPNGKYEYLGFVKNPDGTPFQDCVLFDPAVMNDDGVIRLYTGTALPRGTEITKWNQFFTAKLGQMLYHRPSKEFKADNHPLGAYMLELADDMLTVKRKSKNILPAPTKENGYKGHAYFEGPSIRKIQDTYYFIYSSEVNSELCYATSKYPDRDFVYGGTIVETGDVGINGRKAEDSLNTTGTTHGSIECINGQWYVFYHRLSHGCDYSRQACAEPITIEADGSIKQVPISSCGLNHAPLAMSGTIPATKACVIKNGKMPHICNQKYRKPIPMVKYKDGERIVTNITKGTWIGFRYFDYSTGNGELHLTVRGEGKGTISFYQEMDGVCIGTVEVTGATEWKKVPVKYNPQKNTAPLYIKYTGEGMLELLEISF